MKIVIFSLLVVVMAASACQGRGPAAATRSSDYVAPSPSKPETGKATLVGRVLDPDTGQPMVNMAVRLAEVVRISDTLADAGWVLDDAHSPGGVSDAQGYFVITNVEAKEWVIVVGDMSIRYGVVTEGPDKAKVFVTQADQILDVGTLTPTMQ